MSAGLVSGEEGLADFRVIGGQIVEGNQPAILLHFFGEVLGGLAGVELVRPFSGDAAESGGEFGLAQEFAKLEELAIFQENAFSRGETPQWVAFVFQLR